MGESYRACNKAKTAIIPMGATRRKEVPETLLRELKLPNPSEEPYEIYLGAPIGSDKTKYAEFIESKYRSIKSKLASYRNLQDYTHKGRAMIANTLISSRLRYWAQIMPIPKRINKALDSDIQHTSTSMEQGKPIRGRRRRDEKNE